MRLLWITGRELGSDMASTTEISLATSLKEIGVDVVMIHPGTEKNKYLFEMISVKKIKFPGLNTISGAKNIRRVLSEDKFEFDDFDAVLIDWRYVPFLVNLLSEINNPWYIIDRGPPVNNNFLTWLQGSTWKKAWNIADKYARGGFIVSERHLEYIKKRFTIKLNIEILPAGSEKNVFVRDRKNIFDRVEMAYVGRIDSNRDIKSIIRLSNRLEDIGLDHRIDIFGEGDYSDVLRRKISKNNNIRYLGKIEKIDVQKILAEKHIGIMPMPKKEIWRMASPLKLSEYIAAGLLIVGPKHKGNQIVGDEVWSLLTDGSDWTIPAVQEIVECMPKWDKLSKAAIESQKKVEWEEIAKSIKLTIMKKS
jgi:glycosyltransferase involved in cell wall biosynthesis